MLAAVTMCACSKIDESTISKEDTTSEKITTICVSNDVDAQTKTSMEYVVDPVNGNHITTKWKEGDKIAFYEVKTTPFVTHYFTLTSGAGTTKAVFTADGVGLTPGVDYFALHQGSSDYGTIDAENMYVNYPIPSPQVQSAAGDISHINADNIFYIPKFTAASPQPDLSFNHLLAVLKFNITGDAALGSIKSIQFASEEYYSNVWQEMRRAGMVSKLGVNQSAFSYNNQTSYSVELTTPAPLSSAPSTTYMLALFASNLPVADFPIDFTLNVVTTVGVYSVTVPVSKNIVAGKIYTANVNLTSADALTYPEATDQFPLIINNLMWAPVNCGYEAKTASSNGYVCGKYYQWGRKVGFGYSPDDATYLTNDNYSDALNFVLGTSEPADDKFYSYTNSTKYQWLTDENCFGGFTWWNTLSSSVWGDKIGNPCPAGWRIPKNPELEALQSIGVWDESTPNNPDEMAGYWFGTNASTATASDPKGCMFLPASGTISSSANAVTSTQRGTLGRYAANQLQSNSRSSSMEFNSTEIKDVRNYAAVSTAFSVRCVKE